MTDELTERSILFTGYPGFLSEHLLRRLADETNAHIHLLVLPNTLKTARDRLERMGRQHPSLVGRWTLHAGDITDSLLGLTKSKYDELTGQVGVVWHLAALYDLSVDEAVAYRVNVGGTINVLDFCERCEDLQRLNYVSTCYVAGKRTGTILEDELDLGQHHHNHYEATKFWAEVEVQRRLSDIPTAIFRPAIVVGDSRTGEISKYDGPYYVFQLLQRLPKWLPVPAIGRGGSPVNLVPVDFVADALSHLGHTAGTEGKVFHLADPYPLSATQIVDQVLQRLNRPTTRGRLPLSWVERALEQRTVEGWTGVPREALVYFSHGPRFDTSRASEALGRAGIACPPLTSYLGRLLDFFLAHPDEPAVVIDQSSGQTGGDGASDSGRVSEGSI